MFAYLGAKGGVAVSRKAQGQQVVTTKEDRVPANADSLVQQLCLLDEMPYVLRHSHHHLGEVQVEYRLRSTARVEWRW
jgi:hypothetical protein